MGSSLPPAQSRFVSSVFPLSSPGFSSSLPKKTTIHRCRVYPPPDRIFSLNVVLPTRTLVVLVCKPSAGVEASLVLRTADASQLAHADIPDDECRFLTVASVIVQGLLELHVIELGTTAQQHLCTYIKAAPSYLECLNENKWFQVASFTTGDKQRQEGTKCKYFVVVLK